MSTPELACSYAALILADDGVEITIAKETELADTSVDTADLKKTIKLTLNLSIQADKIQTLLTAAKVQEVEPIWSSIFAKALEGKDIKDLLTNVGAAGSAPAAAAGAAAGGAAAPAEAAAEEKEEEKEESDEDMGFGLFD